jgi:hypothetical protein
VDLDPAPAPLLRRLSIAAPDEHPVQPRLEPVRVADRGQVAPGTDEGFLGRVSRAVRVAQDERGDCVQPADGGRRQGVEGPSVAGDRTSDELSIHPRSSAGTSCAYTVHGDMATTKVPDSILPELVTETL